MLKQFLDWLHGIGHEILDFVAPLAKQIAKSGGIVLAEAALAAVQSMEQTSGLSNQEKFDAAHKIVVKTLQDKGLPVVVNAINGAIEAAVAKLKE